MPTLIGLNETWQLSISTYKCCLLNIAKSPVLLMFTWMVPVFLLYNTHLSWVLLFQVTCHILHISLILSQTCMCDIACVHLWLHQSTHACLLSVQLLSVIQSTGCRPLFVISIFGIRPGPFYKATSWWSPEFVILWTLKRLNVPTLQLRRLRTGLFWCYKIIFGLDRINFDDF